MFGAMKLLAVLFVLSGMCLAQATHKSAMKSKALIAAEERATVAELRVAELEKRVSELEQQTAALTQKSIDLQKNNDDIRVAAKEVLDQDRAFAAEYKKLLDGYNQLAVNYNDMLQKANAAVQEANANSERRQRQMQAALLFQSLSRQQPVQFYTPPTPLILQQTAPIRSIQCVTRNNGPFGVYTDCN